MNMKYKPLYKNREIIKDILFRLIYVRDYIQLIKDITNCESHYYLMVDENGKIK